MPDLQWLGLHSSWLTDVTTDHLQQLTPRDRSLLPNLKSSFQPGAPRDLHLVGLSCQISHFL